MNAKILNEFSQSRYRLAIKLFINFSLALFGLNVFAFSVTPTVLNLVAGEYHFVSVSNVSGTLSAKSSNSNYATVTKVNSSTYRVDAVSPGTAKIEFKENTSDSKVYITVSAIAPNNPPKVGIINGRLLASNCFQCHGTNGSGGFEKLAGKKASEIYKELRNFSNGSEDPTGIMAAHAMGFTDAQMKMIASYFASLR